MHFDTFPYYFSLGVIGAAALEILKLYEYREKLNSRKFQRQMKSPLFWMIVIGMLLASGFFAWALNAETETNKVTIFQIIITGISARSIIRDVVSVRVAQSTVKLGEDDDRVSMRDIFP